MRLWHKDLISYLPDQQLLGQWHKCCSIAKSIHKSGTPNHILVNKIMDYPDDEFNTYADMVMSEMKHRGYEVNDWTFFKWRNNINVVHANIIFRGWHNQRYLNQCFYNLQEKYDCGSVSEEEWRRFEVGYLTRRI